jgi:nucleotide-binding universal stress UspA family protein
MFTKIMVPIDLAHATRQMSALEVAADLAKHYGAELVYTAVTASTPGPMGHNPEEFSANLGKFAQRQAESHNFKASSHAVVSHDPAVELDNALLKAREEIGADLVVMASHVPGIADYLLPSHGGRMASHAGVSVMVVREKDEQ